jgi:hypothetical protein
LFFHSFGFLICQLPFATARPGGQRFHGYQGTPSEQVYAGNGVVAPGVNVRAALPNHKRLLLYCRSRYSVAGCGVLLRRLPSPLSDRTKTVFWIRKGAV